MTDPTIKRWCLGFRTDGLQWLKHAIHIKHGLTGKRETKPEHMLHGAFK